MAGHINRIPATKPQGQWITKTRSSLIIDTRTFHHIVDTTFLLPTPEIREGYEVGFQSDTPPYFIVRISNMLNLTSCKQPVNL